MSEIIINQSEALSAKALGEDLYSRFIAFLDVKEKTQQTYTRALRQLSRYFSENGISQPKREDILSYRQSLQEKLKPTSVQNYITAARLFFKWTAAEGLYPNIADHVKGAKLDRDHKKDYLASSQVKCVLSKLDRTTEQGSRDYAILVLCVTGGLRTIEVSRANIEDLRTVGDSSALFIQGKGRDEKTEYVKLAPQVEAAIRDYLSYRKAASASDPLFASLSNNSLGGRMSTRSISGIVKAALVNAGYNSERLTAHSLRHTAVTLSLLAGRSLEETQQFARHANIATTLIYSHALDKARNGCSEAIANSIF